MIHRIPILWLFLTLSIAGQSPMEQRDQARRQARAAELQQQSRIHAQQRARTEESYRRMNSSSSTEIITFGGTVNLKPMPKESERDRQLIAVGQSELEEVRRLPGGNSAQVVRVFDGGVCATVAETPVKDKQCPPGIWNRGSAYSFRLAMHMPSFLSDIWIEGGKMRVGGLGALGIIGSIEENWSDATLQTGIISKLRAFEPSIDLTSHGREKAMVSRGFGVDGRVFRDKAELRVGAVYLVRNVVFGLPGVYRRSFDVEGRRTPKDKEEDVILVIRAVKKYHDGSWVLAARMLDRRAAPTLKMK